MWRFSAVLNLDLLIAQLSEAKLEIFVCEQYHIITNDNAFAYTISKASNDVACKLFLDCLDMELNALGNLTIMAEELINDKRKIEAYQQDVKHIQTTYSPMSNLERFLVLALVLQT